jgi:hypothetical protein
MYSVFRIRHSGKLVFFSVPMHVDELPDRLAQLCVFERAVRRRLWLISRRLVHEHRPTLEKQHPRIALGAVEYLTDGSVGEIDVIEDFGEFLYEANTQTDPRVAAGSLVALGGCQFVIALFITFLSIPRQENSTRFLGCIGCGHFNCCLQQLRLPHDRVAYTV